MSTTDRFLLSKKAIAFLSLLVTLLLGITIGTLVSDGVLSAEEKDAVTPLKVQGDGAPLLVEDALSLKKGFAQVAQAVEPAVVNIRTTAVVRAGASQGRGAPEELRDFFGDDFWERFFGPMTPQERKANSLGSGVIVDSKGYVLTNFHVLAPAMNAQGVRQLGGRIEVRLHDGGYLSG